MQGKKDPNQVRISQLFQIHHQFCKVIYKQLIFLECKLLKSQVKNLLNQQLKNNKFNNKMLTRVRIS